MATPRVLVFTATYNEIGNIDAFCAQVLALRPEVDLLVVDDSSPDGTGRRLDELAAGERRLAVVHRPSKLGLGTAHKLALMHAHRRAYDALVTLDADFSHEPSAIPAMLRALEGADFVIGSRFAPGGSIGYSGYRLFLSRMASWLGQFALGIGVAEITTSFRAYRAGLLASHGYESLRSRNYTFMMENLFWISQSGYRLAEVPIRFADRRAGESKLPRNAVRESLMLLARLVLARLSGARLAANSNAGDVDCPSCRRPYRQGDGTCLACGAG
ncbi:MAG: polyprenol monophosphomannose synthase [Alphaproteobacteria bacterium]|nr:polyprenol monophosphomannose synthase [Alphaproteobacteria bacterium]